MKVERVVELGCGEYSTLTFLNRLAFPSLIALDSWETEQAWLDKIAASAGSDFRLRTGLVIGEMRSAIENIDLEEYDLIFVDDSTSSEERSRTIREIALRRPTQAVVVIHDFEVQAYREAAKLFRHRFIFRAFTPQTGVVWNGGRGLTKALKRAELVIKHHSKTLEPDHVSDWSKVLAP